MTNENRLSNMSMATKTQQFMFNAPNENDLLKTRFRYLSFVLVLVGIFAAAALGISVMLLIQSKDKDHKTIVWRQEMNDAISKLREEDSKPLEVMSPGMPKPPFVPDDTSRINDNIKDPTSNTQKPHYESTAYDSIDEISINDNIVDLPCDDEDLCYEDSGSGDCMNLPNPVCAAEIGICISVLNGCDIPTCCPVSE